MEAILKGGIYSGRRFTVPEEYDSLDEHGNAPGPYVKSDQVDGKGCTLFVFATKPPKKP